MFYHESMHRHAVILLIVLLGLRGLAADAMALVSTSAMATGGALAGLATGHADSSPAMPLPSQAAHACCELAQDGCDGAKLHDCLDGDACQLCHAASLASIQPARLAFDQPAPRPSEIAADFVSADRAIELKPPIL